MLSRVALDIRAGQLSVAHRVREIESTAQLLGGQWVHAERSRPAGKQVDAAATELSCARSRQREAPAPAFDWIDGYQNVQTRNDAGTADAEKRAASARDAASRPSLPLAKYAGTYRDAWYGDITIVEEGGKLVMRFSHTPSLVGDLEHWQHDTFVARWRDRELRADAFVTFALNPDGSIDRAKMRAVSPATDFSFDFQDLLLKPAGR